MPWHAYQGQVITGEPFQRHAKLLEEFAVKWAELRTDFNDLRLTIFDAELRFIE